MSDDNIALAIHEGTPTELIARVTNAAGACKAIVLQTAMKIQGRQYVRVEGWQAIAVAHGCVASARDVEEIATGIRAIGEVRRMDTGVVIATAEGFVGFDEPLWMKRAEYARRAMAQTRAISRACRSAFAHVVVAMQAGLETTPAEEIPPDDEHRPPLRTVPTPTAGGAIITDPQRKRLFAIAKSAGHADVDVKAWLQAQYGFTSTSDVTRATYEAICTRLADATKLEFEQCANEAEDNLPDWKD